MRTKTTPGTSLLIAAIVMAVFGFIGYLMYVNNFAPKWAMQAPHTVDLNGDGVEDIGQRVGSVGSETNGSKRRMR